MNQEYQDPYLEFEEDEYEGQPFDWVGMVCKLLRYKWFIGCVTFGFIVVGCIIALMRPHIYKVSVSLAPEVASNVRTSSLKSITSLLGVGSASLGNSQDALNITLSPKICASTPFLVSLFDVEVNPTIPQKEIDKGAASGPMSLYTYLSKGYMPEEEPSFISQLLENVMGKDDSEDSGNDDSTIVISNLSKTQQDVVKALGNCIAADIDDKTGVTSISVTMTDIDVAIALADTVCARLQEYITKYRTQKALVDYDYYAKMAEEARKKMVKTQAAYAASVDFDRSVILQSVNSEKETLQQEAALAQQIYSQLKQQEELAQAKVQEMKPVFAVIQPATRPEHAADSRKKLVLAFAFVGFVLSAGWKLFLQDFVMNFRTKLNEARLIEDKKE